MEDVKSFQLYTPKKESNFLKRIYENHQSYFGSIYTACFYIGGAYALLRWVWILFMTAREGNMMGFLLTFIFQGVITFFTSAIFGVIAGTIASLVLFLPYLVVRGLVK